MSYADKCFKETCRDILENGTNTKGEKVRPHWEDGTSAYTIKQFGVVHTYDLQQEFPAITLRQVPLKKAMDEMIWIYQKKSNNVHDLNSHIWDAWADQHGSIRTAYGYQIATKNLCLDVTKEGLLAAFDGSFETNPAGEYVFRDRKSGRIIATMPTYTAKGFLIDQMDKVLYDLKNTPFSRRIITSMWNPQEQWNMALAPCAYSMTYNVTEKDGKMYLNAVLNQRSQDMLTANGWNTAQYAILLMMVAQSTGMLPGKLMHVITDCHIYDRHIPMVEELLKRDDYPAPKVYLNPDKTDFYQFTVEDDLIVEGYRFGEQIKNIPVAV